ncbi:MAG TPA: glucose-6-phosphate dehydrogenase, partial [Pedobacter sp.]
MKTSISLNPTVVVIFGGTGDLNLRKLAPALYNLYADHFMPEKYAIIGTARKQLNDEEFRNSLKEGVNKFSRSGKVKDDKWLDFSGHINYTPVDVASPETFGKLKELIQKYQEEFGPKTQVLYYLAVAPNLFPMIAKCLADFDLAGTEENCRIVIEKPFGRDLETAKELNSILTGIFTEKQIYRIDHYLGKETV